jgi:enamine deaminase RidA (YjgF/YER057c/UK114 family)
MRLLQPAGWPRPRGYSNGFAAMTAVEVSALMEDEAKVEIEVTAVIPDPTE